MSTVADVNGLSIERFEDMSLISAMEVGVTPSNNDRMVKWLETRPGERCLIRVPAADTNGTYSLAEIVSSPGDGTSLHIHQNEDEHLFVLEGTARIACGDKVFDAEAGEVVVLPKKIPHAWGNRSQTPLRIAMMAFPGGIEEILRVIAGGGEPGVPAFAEKFGVRSLGPVPF